jgi:hypothetical protein
VDGVALDEFADMKPEIWYEVVRPMLADRHGWATFIGTPLSQSATRNATLWEEMAMTIDTLPGKLPTMPAAASRITLVGLTLLIGAATAAAQAPAPGTEDPNNWPQYHRTSNAWRYSPLDQINKTNIAKLKVAWIHQGGDITHGIQ